MPLDPELEAIQKVVEALNPLEDSVRRRVVRWLTDRYASDGPTVRHEVPTETARVDAEIPAPADVARRLGELEALYAGAKATAQWERALITGYWLQEIQRRADFNAQGINEAMRECGYGTNNITRELSKLIAGGLVVQQPTANSNGRRRFRLSRDGLRWCHRRLAEM